MRDKLLSEGLLDAGCCETSLESGVRVSQAQDNVFQYLAFKLSKSFVLGRFKRIAQSRTVQSYLTLKPEGL